MAGDLAFYERARLIVRAVGHQHKARLYTAWASNALSNRSPASVKAACDHQMDARRESRLARRALLHLIHGEPVDD